MPTTSSMHDILLTRIMRDDMVREFAGKEITPELVSRMRARAGALIAIKAQLVDDDLLE